jgi:putative alpha-1,2-mannosidase
MVPHDLASLFTYMGGSDAAVARLDTLFTELNAGTERPYFYIGNEPEHGTPWAYAFAGAPEKTTEVVRRIVDEAFHTGPGGLPGNDDLGATSAWLVWAYLGLYPAIPGTDILVAHGPLLPAITLHLANGATLRIVNQSDGDGAYVRGISIDGVPTSRSWVRFAEISHGATLTFTTGEPNESWGRAETDRPPSFPPGP